MGNVDELADMWLHLRPACTLFHAASIEMAHRHIRSRVTNLCSVHSGNQLSLTTPHFHWEEPPQDQPTHLDYMTWTGPPLDQHPDIFVQTAQDMPTCFSLYLAKEMSWTYTLRVTFHREEVEEDGVERWTAPGGWILYFGRMVGPMAESIRSDREVKLRRLCPCTVMVPLDALVRMMLLGPDQGY
jgi:hypothetical protein